MKYISLLIMAAGIMMLGACKEKKKQEDIITTKYVPKRPQAPIAMAEEHLKNTVRWHGKDYVVSIDKVASDSLPMVSDEIGQEYIDNIITLTITRIDKSVFFYKEFTVKSFSSYLAGDYSASNSLLSSIRFNEVDDGKLEFSVIITHPDALDDEYMSLTLKVDTNKGYIVSVDNDLMDELEDDYEEPDSLDTDN